MSKQFWEHEPCPECPRLEKELDRLERVLEIATKSLRDISSGLTTDQRMVERMTKREADETLKEIELVRRKV